MYIFIIIRYVGLLASALSVVRASEAFEAMESMHDMWNRESKKQWSVTKEHQNKGKNTGSKLRELNVNIDLNVNIRHTITK